METPLDPQGCRDLAADLAQQALAEAIRGDYRAEYWLKTSRIADAALSRLGLGPDDIAALIERRRAGTENARSEVT